MSDYSFLSFCIGLFITAPALLNVLNLRGPLHVFSLDVGLHVRKDHFEKSEPVESVLAATKQASRCTASVRGEKVHLHTHPRRPSVTGVLYLIL